MVFSMSRAGGPIESESKLTSTVRELNPDVGGRDGRLDMTPDLRMSVRFHSRQATTGEEVWKS